MSRRADQRAARFGLNLRLNCVTRALTVGQITEVIHAYVQSQTTDGKRQYELTGIARSGFTSADTAAVNRADRDRATNPLPKAKFRADIGELQP